MKGYREKPYTAPVANRLKRAERLARWDDIAVEAKRADPVSLTGYKHARYKWIQAIVASDLPSTSRLVAHTLALHGRADGTDMFAGVRVLAAEAGVSQTTISEHLEALQLAGYLWRQTAGRGFVYKLCAPRKIAYSMFGSSPWEKDPEWRPAESSRSAEAHSAPTAQARSALAGGATAEASSALINGLSAQARSAVNGNSVLSVDNSTAQGASATDDGTSATDDGDECPANLNECRSSAERVPKELRPSLDPSLRFESRKESKSIVSAGADRYAPSTPSEDEIRAKIRKLAKAGISDDEIIRMLAQYKLTPEQVAAAHAQGQQPDG